MQREGLEMRSGVEGQIDKMILHLHAKSHTGCRMQDIQRWRVLMSFHIHVNKQCRRAVMRDEGCSMQKKRISHKGFRICMEFWCKMWNRKTTKSSNDFCICMEKPMWDVESQDFSLIGLWKVYAT